MTLSRSFPEHDLPGNILHFDFAIYALGAHLPPPLDPWDAEAHSGSLDSLTSNVVPGYHGRKDEAIDWLKRNQKRVEESASVLVVGGGALGIRMSFSLPSIQLYGS